MEAAQRLPSPNLPAPDGDTTPTLPQAQARPAPAFERRLVEVQPVARPREHRISLRGYGLVLVGLLAAAAAGWFTLSQYIYG